MKFEPAIVYIAAMKAEIISLSARLKAAKEFTLNTDMKLECDLLRSQIKGLEDEVERMIV